MFYDPGSFSLGASGNCPRISDRAGHWLGSTPPARRNALSEWAELALDQQQVFRHRLCDPLAQLAAGTTTWTIYDMTERVGFEALNAEPCTALYGLARTQKTRHLSEFPLSSDFNRRVLHANSHSECSTAAESVASDCKLRYIPIFLLSSAVMPPNFSNRSAIRFMIFRSAVVSPEGRKRYQRASCSLSAFSTSSNVGNPFTRAPSVCHSTTP
jgi:hypothetical protein